MHTLIYPQPYFRSCTQSLSDITFQWAMRSLPRTHSHRSTKIRLWMVPVMGTTKHKLSFVMMLGASIFISCVAVLTSQHLCKLDLCVGSCGQCDITTWWFPNWCWRKSWRTTKQQRNNSGPLIKSVLTRFRWPYICYWRCLVTNLWTQRPLTLEDLFVLLLGTEEGATCVFVHTVENLALRVDTGNDNKKCVMTYEPL